jgi:two-component system sensor histidine kinase HydH
VTAPRWTQWIRTQDIVWLVLFSGMAALSPGLDQDAVEFPLSPWSKSGYFWLILLGAAQIAEPKVSFRNPTAGKVFWIGLKLVLGYFLIGYTGALISPYFFIFLLPVVSAATLLNAGWTLLFTLLACGSYLSFVLFIDFSQYTIEPDQVRELLLRLLFLAVAGNLANILAQALREQSAKYKAAAEQLADANRQLQEAEAAVRRSDRLAALGQLSAGLAHELRNPLGTIKASAEVLTANVSRENEVSREMAGFISSEVDRTNSLVTRFLEFARPLQLRFASTELSQVIDHAAALVERDGGAAGVSIRKEYGANLSSIPLDAELMERVFYNLLLNAAQASPAGSQVTVRTWRTNGGAVSEVIDQGSGIEPKIRESIFNPFFTTKPEGVGLGLAIVAKIVDEHGGKIAVESEPGQGSIFRVSLPASRKA